MQVTSKNTVPSEPMSTTEAPLNGEALFKAEALIEALPWLKEFAQKRVVVKYGGNAMTSPSLKQAFAQDMVFMRQVGIQPIVVHGGGPQITQMLERLGIPTEFKAGLRYTSEEAMEIIRMVLTGQVSRELVGLMNQHGHYAVGMSGEDGGLFSAEKMKPVIDGVPLDVGLVGEVRAVDARGITDILGAQRIPVVSSVAPNREDPTQVLNVNADLAAASLASAVGARKLVILTNVEGLFTKWPDTSEVVSTIGVETLRELLPSLHEGMRPKMHACIQALDSGVQEAHIINGCKPHSLLTEIFTRDGIGTMVVPGHGLTLRKLATA